MSQFQEWVRNGAAPWDLSATVCSFPLTFLGPASLDPPFPTYVPGEIGNFVKTGFPCPNPSGLC